MSTTRAFGVVGMDGAVADGRYRRLDEPCFVDRVGVDRHLHVELVGHAQASVDSGGRRPPVLMELEATGSRAYLFRQRLRCAAVPFAEETDIDRPGIGGLQHAREVPCPWRTGGGI